MIKEKYKGFTITYYESPYSASWNCEIKVSGKGSKRISESQLHEVKKKIDEALQVSNYEPIEGYCLSLDFFIDQNRSSFYREGLDPKLFKVKDDFYRPGRLNLTSSNHDSVEENKFFPKCEENEKIIEELKELKKKFTGLRQEIYKKFDELKTLDKSTLVKITTDLNAFIKKKKTPLTQIKKTQMIEKLHKEIGMERLLCSSVLKDTKWNYQSAATKLRNFKNDNI
jgi:hypothetical protein